MEEACYGRRPGIGLRERDSPWYREYFSSEGIACEPRARRFEYLGNGRAVHRDGEWGGDSEDRCLWGSAEEELGGVEDGAEFLDAGS